MPYFILIPGSSSHRCPVPRPVITIAWALLLLTLLLAISGCDDVKGAASGTAGQLNEREKREKEATDILDGGLKR